MTQLILHPKIVSLQGELEASLAAYQNLVGLVESTLRKLAEDEDVSKALLRLEHESNAIQLLFTSFVDRTGNQTVLDIGGEVRSLRSFLDGDASVKDQARAARCRDLYRKLASRYHPRMQGTGNSELFRKAQMAYKSHALEVLFSLYCEAFGYPAAQEEGAESGEAYIKSLIDRLNGQTLKLKATESYQLMAMNFTGNRAKAVARLHKAIEDRIIAYQVYRTKISENANAVSTPTPT